MPEFGYNIELGGNYEGKHSVSTCTKISLSKIGKPRTEATKQKISQTLMHKMVGAKNARSRQIICLETEEVFDALRIAANIYQIDQGSLTKCCQGKLKTVHGLHWMYYEDYLKGGEN